MRSRQKVGPVHNVERRACRGVGGTRTGDKYDHSRFTKLIEGRRERKRVGANGNGDGGIGSGGK